VSAKAVNIHSKKGKIISGAREIHSKQVIEEVEVLETFGGSLFFCAASIPAPCKVAELLFQEGSWGQGPAQFSQNTVKELGEVKVIIVGEGCTATGRV
jgi:hypothetical protein